MSTLDISKKKIIFGYLIYSLFCILINIIYSKFSHGVSSNYMTYMFLIPLVFGSIIFIIVPKYKLNNISKYSLTFYSLSIITFTTFLLIKGIFEIAGSVSSDYEIFYIIAALILLFISIITHKKKHV